MNLSTSEKVLSFIFCLSIAAMVSVLLAAPMLLHVDQYQATGARALLMDAANSTYMEDAKGYSSKLLEEAEYEGAAVEYADKMAELLDGRLPKAIDELLYDRGWKITLTDKDPHDIIPFGNVWGVCHGGFRDITVTVNNGQDVIVVDTEQRIATTVLHELGHAVDYECGRLSNTKEFKETISSTSDYNTPTNDFALSLNEAGEEIHEKFAAAFAYYAMYPNYDDSCPAYYDWITSTIMPSLKYDQDWSIDKVEWSKKPSKEKISQLEKKYGTGTEMALNLLAQAPEFFDSRMLSFEQSCDLYDSAYEWQKGMQTLARRNKSLPLEE